MEKYKNNNEAYTGGLKGKRKKLVFATIFLDIIIKNLKKPPSHS